MRLFFYPLVLTIFLLCVFAQVATPILKHETIHTLPVHKTLYLERGLDDQEVSSVVEAAIEWYDATDGQINFDIKSLPQKEIDPVDSIVILNLSPDYPEVMLLDTMNHQTTLGYFNDDMSLNYIALLGDRLDENIRTEVVLHELGHAIGLQHLEGAEGLGSLMYPTTDLGSQHITYMDLEALCHLYHCSDASKFHVLP